MVESRGEAAGLEKCEGIDRLDLAIVDHGGWTKCELGMDAKEAAD